ncbi:MAG: hypothetical protein GXX79_12310 [Actinomycetales bacterium]|nr:hypothetical protein [Actinomycetales bacterium]
MNSGPAVVEVRLLGPLEAFVAGEPVVVVGQRSRALLAVLALTPGEVVPLSRIVEAVWGLDAPASALTGIGVHVARLRRVLAGRGGYAPLRRAEGGYLLDLPGDAVDAIRFERLAAEGRARRADGDPVAALAALRAAAGLWRGPALGDLREEPAFAAAAARLEEARRSVLADVAGLG